MGAEMKELTLVWMDKIREMINQNYDDKMILNVLIAFGESEEKRIANKLVK